MSASLVGLGLARFSYTPLIPALIAAKWFSASDVVYLGAANLAGYLAGALAARDLAARIGAVRALRAMMLLATLSFFASSTPVSFTWFFAWRFLSGLTGGIIMVLAASVILPHASAARRGIVGGVIFAGVGLGVAASGTLVPLLLQQGLQQSWYGLGVLSAVLTLVSWWNWPAEAKSRYRAFASREVRSCLARRSRACWSSMASTRWRWCRTWSSSSTSSRAASARALPRDRATGCCTVLAPSSARSSPVISVTARDLDPPCAPRS